MVSVVAQDNVVLHRRAFQSSIWRHYNASLAVDGKTDGHFDAAKSCTATDWELSPWWAVDMGTTLHVDAVQISNRVDLSKLITYRLKLEFVCFSCSDISAQGSNGRSESHSSFFWRTLTCHARIMRVTTMQWTRPALKETVVTSLVFHPQSAICKKKRLSPLLPDIRLVFFFVSDTQKFLQHKEL